MAVWLSLDPSLEETLLAHMHAGAEHIAFMSGSYKAPDGVFALNDLYIIPPDEVLYEDTHVTVGDDHRQSVLEWATSRGDMLVEAHSHGSLGDPVAFSDLDLRGFDSWVPHVRWRLGGRPYAALVFGSTTIDGLAWVGPSPERVSRLESAGRIHKTTGRSFARIAADRPIGGDGERYRRNVGLLGTHGQRLLGDTAVGVVGLGGLGSHVVQQLAYLGIRRFVLIDHDEVETSNLNRLIGATPADIGEPKVKIAERLIDAIQPGGQVRTVGSRIDSPFDTSLLARVDVVFGCVDNDSARLALTEFTSRDQVPYIDLASDTGRAGELTWFGGRVFLASDGDQCLSCVGELDQTALAISSMDPAQLAANESIYGVDRSMLEGGGPMVVSVNGVVASLGVTEFIALVTGFRRPNPHVVYRGDRGIVTLRTDKRSGSCYYCDTLWRNRDE